MQESISYRMVLVEWVDSYGCAPAWGEIPDKKPVPHHCFSAGWLAMESEDAIVIIPHISPQHDEIGADEQGCGDMTIPKVAIRKITDLAPR